MLRRLSNLIRLALVLAVIGAGVAAGETWEGVVAESPDAVEDQLSRGMYSGSSDLELPYDGGVQVIGLRFLNVRVPQGASIDRAYIEFTADEVEVDLPVNLIIDGQLKANPLKFGSSGFDVANRERTNAKALWQPEHFPAVGGKHQTSDISLVIEEIVNLADWSNGSDLVLIISDNPDNPSLGHRTVETGRGDDSSPLLHIEWSLGNAGSPNPPDGATEVSRDADLSWSAGVFAAPTDGQTLFFSDSFEDVNDGVGGMTQSVTTYDPGRLAFGTTYYWRVRQNNEDSADQAVNEGRVWSFTTEFFSYPISAADISATASSSGQDDFGPENTINGSGLDVSDLHSTVSSEMWLSGTETDGAWIQYEFDHIYKLYEMQVWNYNVQFETVLGFGLKNVSVEYSVDGTDWTVLGDVEFAQGTSGDDYAANTVIEFNGVAAQYVRLIVSSNWGGGLPQYGLSEVRFLYLPVTASDPVPNTGAVNVDVDVALTWRAGREAVSHDVHVGVDEQAVIDGTAPVTTVTDATFSPASLALDTSYFWKVTEVNDTENPATWESSVWSFATKNHVVVDNFESYNGQADMEIYTTWVDGFDAPTNGSQVGYLESPFAETTTVRSGRQSMPLVYNNTGGATYSEGTRTFDGPQDWTDHGVTTLVIWFRGTVDNTGQLYAKINDTKITYDGDAANVGLEAWQTWNIDLAASGASVQAVRSLAVGIEGAGAKGTLYVDDIGLYAAPVEPVNEWRIASDADDVEEAVATGSMDVGSSDLELGYEGVGQADPQIIGLRFTGIPIPQGATITEAWVRFQVDEDKGGAEPVNLLIHGERSANAAAFSSAPLSVSSRTTTEAQVQWSVPNWTTVGDQGPDQTTPDLTSIIQEIVNQNDWAGGAIVLTFRDDPDNPSLGVRCAEAGPGDDAALLHISYE